MSTNQAAASSTSPTATWRPDDRWLLGIVLAVINFWLFAQTLLNVIPGISDDLGMSTTIANLAVSVTSLMSGCFIVVFGGLADRLGREKVMNVGIWLSIVGSALIVLPFEGTAASATMLSGRIVQGLSAACIMPSTMALVKTYYEGKERQQALSYWSIGSWGGSGFCSLFGGLMATSALGWRSIFYISIALSFLALYLVKDTPVSKASTAAAPGMATTGTGAAAASGDRRGFDWSGLITFVVAMLAINIYISQGPRIGWLSATGLALVAVFVVTILLFFKVETSRDETFMDLGLFANLTFSGATLSNFLLNGAAGTLIVSLGLVQRAAGFTSLQSGLLTLGYLIAILATIRVGEKFLQRFGPRRPMLWGSMITASGILLTSATFVLIEQYVVLAFIGFTLFGVGLGFYATPSTDAALSNVPDAQAGSASGIYKMASSLGAAFGVAISAAIFTAGQNIDPALIPVESIFMGRQENIALRFGGALALLFNVFMCLVALISIMVTVPRERPRDEQAKQPEVPATPMIGA
ncbi:DHA2 family multidrug resistance protein-like MFS transporter [Georgenia soli]|uniref:DHA2 family multidrug resistance protein-like MFS transporter n=1 Tax=Georgenia soli TaxID=638953 RepID=A0A2A9ENL7_9MICO|nr:MFS transporter [Georgenia soli]PFG39845.1 DHA2 family multidrug resistance protein-like MFS transporter [Georgenia soli]